MDKYERERLNKVTGKWVKDCYKWLKRRIRAVAISCSPRRSCMMCAFGMSAVAA